MRALTELFVQGRRAGFEFDLRPSAPAYLHDAAAWAADATRLPLLPDTEPADPSPGPAGVDLVGAEGTAPGASVRLHDAAAWAADAAHLPLLPDQQSADPSPAAPATQLADAEGTVPGGPAADSPPAVGGAKLVVEAARGDWLATHLPLLPGGQAADSPHAPAGAKLVIAGEIVAVRPDDWLVADLPGGADVLPARALAWKLAEAGAQAYELLRLEGGRAVLVAHGVSRPEAVGPALDLVPGTRGWLRAGMAASDTEILAALNATVLGPVQASNAAAAMTRRYLREVAPLREGLVESHEEQVAHLEGQTQSLTVEVERLKGELTERYAREDALRARLARIDATPWRRLRRKLARVVRLMRAKASGEGDGSR